MQRNKNVQFTYVPMGSKCIKNLDGIWELTFQERVGTPEEREVKIAVDRSVVVLDVGNELAPGLIDHHHMRSETSATALVAQFPEYVTDWLKTDEPITLVLHQAPDMDCLSSAYLTMCLIEQGKLPEGAAQFARYVTEVDQGRIPVPDFTAPAPYFFFEMAKEIDLRGKTWDDWVTWAFDFFDYLFSHQEPDTSQDFSTIFQKEHPYRTLQEAIEKDYRKYRLFLDDPEKTRFFNLQIPQKSTRRPCLVDGLYLRDPDQGAAGNRLFKIWARSDVERSTQHLGFRFLWVEFTQGITPEKAINGKTSRHVLSVEPTSGLDLKGLGTLLNLWEKEEIIEHDNKHTSNKLLLIAPGEKEERWKGVGLSDPWYDGRGHEDTIVDTPRRGTILDRERIETAIQNFLYEEAHRNLEIQEATVVVHLAFEAPRENFSLSSWNEDLLSLPKLNLVDYSDQTRKTWSEDNESPGWSVLFENMMNFETPNEPGNRSNRRFLRMERAWNDKVSLEHDWFLHRVRILLHSAGVGMFSIELKMNTARWDNLSPITAQKVGPRLLAFNKALLPGKQLLQNRLRLNVQEHAGAEALEKLTPLLDFFHEHRIDYFTRQVPAWSVVFHNLHQVRHPRYANRFFSAMSAHRSRLIHVTAADERQIRGGERVGEYGRMFVSQGGAFLMLNGIDPKQDQDKRRTALNEYHFVALELLRYHLLKKSLLQLYELRFSKLVEVAKKQLDRLHELRSEVIQTTSELVHSGESHLALVNSMEQLVMVQLDNDRRHQSLLENLENQDEYLTSRQELRFQKQVTIVTGLILPLTLITDYLGNFLGNEFKRGWHLIIAVLVAYSLVLAVYYGIRKKLN